METKIDHFANKSKSWDMNSKRVQNAKGIAELIVNNIKLNKSMEIMDFGAGTGLLSYFVAPYVEKIVAVDNSPSMLLEFQNKCGQFSCNTEVVEKDLSTDTLDRKFDGIVSSMTIHHLEDIPALFSKFYTMLDEHGFIALADLDSEDGTFHSDNTGVEHFGFEMDKMKNIFIEAGLNDVSIDILNKIEKPHNTYEVFIIKGKK